MWLNIRTPPGHVKFEYTSANLPPIEQSQHDFTKFFEDIMNFDYPDQSPSRAPSINIPSTNLCTPTKFNVPYNNFNFDLPVNSFSPTKPPAPNSPFTPSKFTLPADGSSHDWYRDVLFKTPQKTTPRPIHSASFINPTYLNKADHIPSSPLRLYTDYTNTSHNQGSTRFADLSLPIFPKSSPLYSHKSHDFLWQTSDSSDPLLKSIYDDADAEDFLDHIDPALLNEDAINGYYKTLTTPQKSQLPRGLFPPSSPLVPVPDKPKLKAEDNSQQYAQSMLTPLAFQNQPPEKRKRGRPKGSLGKFKKDKNGTRVPRKDSSVEVIQSKVETPIETPPILFEQLLADPPEPKPTLRRGPGRPKKDGPLVNKSKREIAYIQMEDYRTIYDEYNISELLFRGDLKPGRKAVAWIQRHPYGGTRFYKDLSHTWCRYRHCKGVEGNNIKGKPMINQTRNKHPRTIIAGQYQVAIDLNYVPNDEEYFKGNEKGQKEYNKRDVYNSTECYFHLRCFEKIVHFPSLIRMMPVMVDHRVLNDNRTINKENRRKSKGGSNLAEIEWYLTEDADAWIKKVIEDPNFNPLPGSKESLDQLLTIGKKGYTDKKVGNLLSTPLRKEAAAKREELEKERQETKAGVLKPRNLLIERVQSTDVDVPFNPFSASTPEHTNFMKRIFDDSFVEDDSAVYKKVRTT